MKKMIARQQIIGSSIFGLSIALSSCAAFQPVDVGLFVTYKKPDASTEMIFPVDDQNIESPQDNLILLNEEKGYYFYSEESVDQFETTVENFVLSSP